MKSFSKTILVVYLAILAWIVLCKTSTDFAAVLAYQHRSLNVIPFADASRSEVISNVIVFVPLGLLLAINLKQSSFWRKLAIIFAFSLVTELVQYALSIGASDITDVMANTFGGFIALALYALAAKYIDHKKLDQFIVIAITIVLILCLWLRFMVLRVRY